jgi:transposase-like protein
MWTAKGMRPVVVTITGSHQKTCVFGVLSSIKGIQFFRQYNTFDQDTFLQYLKELQRKFFRKKLILFLDRAA